MYDDDSFPCPVCKKPMTNVDGMWECQNYRTVWHAIFDILDEKYFEKHGEYPFHVNLKEYLKACRKNIKGE